MKLCAVRILISSSTVPSTRFLWLQYRSFYYQSCWLLDDVRHLWYKKVTHPILDFHLNISFLSLSAWPKILLQLDVRLEIVSQIDRLMNFWPQCGIGILRDVCACLCVYIYVYKRKKYLNRCIAVRSKHIRLTVALAWDWRKASLWRIYIDIASLKRDKCEHYYTQILETFSFAWINSLKNIRAGIEDIY